MAIIHANGNVCNYFGKCLVEQQAQRATRTRQHQSAVPALRRNTAAQRAQARLTKHPLLLLSFYEHP